MAARGSRGRPPGRRPLAGVEEEEFWDKVRPGDHLALKFEDDEVWHEVMFAWAVSNSTAVIYTPDEDLYPEYLFAPALGGATQVLILEGPGGAKPLGIDQLYRFAEAPSDDERRVLIRKGRAAAAKECRTEGEELPQPAHDEVRAADGELVPLRDFFGGRFPGLRATAGAAKKEADDGAGAAPARAAAKKARRQAGGAAAGGLPHQQPQATAGPGLQVRLHCVDALFEPRRMIRARHPM